MALEVEIKRLTNENIHKKNLVQQFDENECAYKEDIVTLKTQLKEGRKTEEGMRKKYNEREDQC